MGIKELAQEINSKSVDYEIGNLHSIRKNIKGLKSFPFAPMRITFYICIYREGITPLYFMARSGMRFFSTQCSSINPTT